MEHGLTAAERRMILKKVLMRRIVKKIEDEEVKETEKIGFPYTKCRFCDGTGRC